MLKKTIKTTAWIMIIMIVSKILGFTRETFIANYFGASIESDAFYVAFMIPSVLFSSIANSIGISFIPIYSRTEESSRIYFTNNLFNILGFLTIILSIISIILAPLLVKLFASGFSNETQELTVKLTRILLLIMISLALNTITIAKLQSNEKFFIPASIGIPYNIIIIGYLILLDNTYGIIGLTWSIVIASIFQFFYLLPSLSKTGWRYKFTFNWRDEGIIQVLKLSRPIILGSAVAQINIIIDRMFASYLVEGSISSLNYANKLIMLSYGIIVIAIVAVLYPKQSTYAKNNKLEELTKLTTYGIKSLIIILLPITFGGIVLAEPIIKTLFERGAFNATDTKMTSIAFALYSIGLLGMGIRELLNKTYYSLQDTKTPMINGIIALVLNIILNFILVKYLQHGGLALATSICFIITSILLFRGLKKKLIKIADKDLWYTLIKTIISSSIMAIVVYNLYYSISFEGKTSLLELAWLLIAIIIGVFVYLVFSILLKQSLLVSFIKDLQRKINR